MNISDPIADMLTRVRNASRARHTEVVVPASRTKREIARILVEEGFIAGFREERDGAAPGAAPAAEVRRRQGAGRLGPQADQQARPSRATRSKTDIPRVLGGLGIVIVSTSKGIMTGSQAKQAQLGGEILAYVW